MPTTEPIIRVRGLTKSYPTEHGRRLQVLSQLSFDVAPGSWTMLLGSSGSGKSTLLNLLSTMDSPDNGSIHLFNQDITKLGARGRAALRQRRLGFVFQSFHLLPELSALDNIMLPAIFTGTPRAKIRQRAEELLDRVGLAERSSHRPNALSGGEQQRVALARALVNDPDLIIADEPTGNLDPGNAELVIKLFGALCRDSGKTILMVTHNHALRQHADKVLSLTNGRLDA